MDGWHWIGVLEPAFAEACLIAHACVVTLTDEDLSHSLPSQPPQVRYLY